MNGPFFQKIESGLAGYKPAWDNFASTGVEEELKLLDQSYSYSMNLRKDCVPLLRMDIPTKHHGPASSGQPKLTLRIERNTASYVLRPAPFGFIFLHFRILCVRRHAIMIATALKTRIQK